MNTHVVIMAGGIGSRFWPMSIPEYPKQFIDVMGVGRTLIQLTFDRFCKGDDAICRPENVWIATSALYRDIILEQLPEVPESHFLWEPVGRNTAPCIAYASWSICNVDPDANIIVTPSDALVLDNGEYRRVIRQALEKTSDGNAIVTIGISPTRPETGYGYIEAPVTGHVSGAGVAAGPVSGIRKVVSFKEKPNQATAESYLAAGGYLWNAGIFVWNVKTIVSAIREYVPQIAGVMDKIYAADDFAAATSMFYAECEKISIDYAVMEKSTDIYTIPGDFGWSDLGTWGSLKVNLPKDDNANAVVSDGEVRLFDCKGCVVHTSGEKLVVLQGLEDCIVAQKDGRLLVCRLSDEQRIKEFSAD